jgi:hypothetical protein
MPNIADQLAASSTPTTPRAVKRGKSDDEFAPLLGSESGDDDRRGGGLETYEMENWERERTRNENMRDVDSRGKTMETGRQKAKKIVDEWEKSKKKDDKGQKKDKVKKVVRVMSVKEIFSFTETSSVKENFYGRNKGGKKMVRMDDADACSSKSNKENVPALENQNVSDSVEDRAHERTTKSENFVSVWEKREDAETSTSQPYTGFRAADTWFEYSVKSEPASSTSTQNDCDKAANSQNLCSQEYLPENAAVGSASDLPSSSSIGSWHKDSGNESLSDIPYIDVESSLTNLAAAAVAEEGRALPDEEKALSQVRADRTNGSGRELNKIEEGKELETGRPDQKDSEGIVSA